VIVYDATAGIFPHRLSTDIEEERRVFHVAITRAQRSLQIVSDESNPSIFLEELRAEGSPPKRVAEPARPRSQGRGRSDGGGETAAPTVGLMFSWGGYDCTVSAITDGGVVVSIGSSTMTVPFGSEVTIKGRAATLSRSAKASTHLPLGASRDVEPAIVAALKVWRLERSRRDGVPAYVVFDDKTLEAIVVGMPSTEQELLGVSGMGTKRVELYGDEIIALLDALRPRT
jgi:hypothetical protein